jgi:membrane protease subunit HflK
MVDSRSNSNLLYLPLDKLMQQSAAAATPTPPAAAPVEVPAGSGVVDIRSRDAQRGRERESR